MVHFGKTGDWHEGYDRASMGFPLNKGRSKDWQDGWHQYHYDIESGEYETFY